MRTRGFTIIEAVAIVIMVLVVIGFLIIPNLGRGTPTNPQHKDASQLRGIVQSMIIWAANNKDMYPLPSQLDADGATVAGPAAAKNTTANIYSILIFSGHLDPRYFVSMAEVGNIRPDNDYQTSAPPAAVDPARALWDPAFRADFTGRSPGNTSYAHMAPVDAAGKPWWLSFSSQRAVLGNRGPHISAVTHSAAGEGPEFTLTDPQSNTLRIHGSRTSWAGNIAYDDNHVSFETSMAPEDLLYTLPSGARQRDTLFFDEPDDATGANNYLTITIPAPEIAGGRAIWD